MTKQVIFYTQGLRYEVEPTEGRQLLLGASEKAQVYLPQQGRKFDSRLMETRFSTSLGRRQAS